MFFVFNHFCRSLQKSLKETKAKDRVQKMLDVEIDSVASKEYDPNNIMLRSGRFRSSHVVQSSSNNNTVSARGGIREMADRMQRSIGLSSSVAVKGKEANMLSKMITGRN